MKPRHFVYLLTDGTFQKVGRTTSPKRRIVALQSGNPRPLGYLALWHVTDDMAQHAENMCVVRFRQFWALPIKSRKRPTEWFSLEADIMGFLLSLIGKPIEHGRALPPAVDVQRLGSSGLYLAEAVQ